MSKHEMCGRYIEGAVQAHGGTFAMSQTVDACRRLKHPLAPVDGDTAAFYCHQRLRRHERTFAPLLETNRTVGITFDAETMHSVVIERAFEDRSVPPIEHAQPLSGIVGKFT